MKGEWNFQIYSTSEFLKLTHTKLTGPEEMCWNWRALKYGECQELSYDVPVLSVLQSRKDEGESPKTGEKHLSNENSIESLRCE